MLKHVIVALAIGASLIAPCEALSQRVERPTWRVGDIWTYRVTTTYADQSKPAVSRMSRQSITRVTPEVIEIASLDEVGTRSLATTWSWNLDGEVLNRRLQSQAPLFYRPPIRFHQWPSEPGQRWSSNFDTVTQGGKRVDTLELSLHVTGWETVTVPAGKYRALKSEGRSSRPNSGYTSEAETWFAPDAKRRVKLVERNFQDGKLVTTLVNELVRFIPAP